MKSQLYSSLTADVGLESQSRHVEAAALGLKATRGEDGRVLLPDGDIGHTALLSWV